MKLVTIKIIFAVVISAAGVVAACGQDTVFSDPNVEYSFLVPSTTWKEIVFPSAAQPKVEFTYGDRRDGHLSIRRLPVAKDSIKGIHMMEFLAIIYAWVGEKDLATEQLQATLAHPGSITYGQLRLHPWWDPLRGDPRFEKIVESLGRDVQGARPQ